MAFWSSALSGWPKARGEGSPQLLAHPVQLALDVLLGGRAGGARGVGAPGPRPERISVRTEHDYPPGERPDPRPVR